MATDFSLVVRRRTGRRLLLLLRFWRLLISIEALREIRFLSGGSESGVGRRIATLASVMQKIASCVSDGVGTKKLSGECGKVKKRR